MIYTGVKASKGDYVLDANGIIGVWHFINDAFHSHYINHLAEQIPYRLLPPPCYMGLVSYSSWRPS